MNNQIQMDDNPYAAPQTPMFNEPQAETISLKWWFLVHLGIKIAEIIFFPIALVATIIAIFMTDNKSKKNYFIAYLLKFVIIIPIVAIIAAIMLPAYQDYTKRAKVSQTISETSIIKLEVEDAYRNKQPLSSIDTEPFKRLHNVQNVEIQDNGTVIVTVDEKIDPQNRSFTLTPQMDNGEITPWKCSSNGLPNRYLPQECRQ